MPDNNLELSKEKMTCAFCGTRVENGTAECPKCKGTSFIPEEQPTAQTNAPKEQAGSVAKKQKGFKNWSKKKKIIFFTVIAVVALAIIIPTAASGGSSSDKVSPPDGTGSIKWYDTSSLKRTSESAAKQIMKEKALLYSPNDAQWHEVSYVEHNLGKYIVFIDVSSKNAFGVYVRSKHFVCVEFQEEDYKKGTFYHNPNFYRVEADSKNDNNALTLIKAYNSYNTPDSDDTGSIKWYDTSSLKRTSESAAKQIMKEALLYSPNDAQWHEVSYVEHNLGKYIVFIDVSSKNAFGVYVRSKHFVCVEFQEEDYKKGTFYHNPNFYRVEADSKNDNNALTLIKAYNSYNTPDSDDSGD